MDQQKQPGIRFLSLLLKEARYWEKPVNEWPSQKAQQLEFSFEIEGRLISDSGQESLFEEQVGEVEFGMIARPKTDNPYFTVEVVLVGTFSYIKDRKNMELEDFLENHAPALLLPYAREVITNLTARTRVGAVLIHPINVRALLEAQRRKVVPAEGV